MTANMDNIATITKSRVEAGRRADGTEENGEPSLNKLPHTFVRDCLEANEDGDAVLFQSLNPDLIFDHDEFIWYEFSNGYWYPFRKGEEFLRIERVISCYGTEINRLSWLITGFTKEGKDPGPTERRRNEFLKRIRLLHTVNRKKNILQLATKGQGVTTDEVMALQSPWFLPCQNGVVDLRTGELRPGLPEEHIRTFLPYPWVDIFDEPCPIWEKTLGEIFGGDPELIPYIQRLFGYACTGHAREHILPILWGQGRNGKTTIVETISRILGAFAHKCRAEILLDSQKVTAKGGADADTLALRNKRLVLASETNENRRFNVAMLKELVGGDTLNARGLYQTTPTTFRPTHTLILLTNHKPHAPASDFAFWERVHLIPFNFSFVDREPEKDNEFRADKELSEKLEAEATGILAWMVRGCLKWQQMGLAPPAAVRNATAAYQKAEDLISQFIEERCEIGPKFQVQAGPLYQDYREWSAEGGIKSLSQRKFGEDIKNRFDFTTGRHVFYIGIGLKYSDSVQGLQ